MAIKFSLSGGKPILVPDIKYLVKFANGDLGIGDTSKTKTIIKNVSQMTSEEQLDIFKKSMGFELQKDSSSYFKNGKYQIKKSDILLDPSTDSAGLKALEKSLIQSIFESEKPYMEIIKELAGILVKVEDVISRVLSVNGDSLKPIFNKDALGYKPNGKSELNKALSQLNSIKEISKGITQSIGKDPVTITSLNNLNNTIGLEYQILSTVYSTGDFNPNVNYTYEYIDIIDDSIKESDLSDSGVDILDIQEAIDKPKIVVFGFFDANGNPVENNNIPKWLIDSGKWFGQFDSIGDFKYIWSHPIFGEKKSIASPSGPGWKMKKNERDEPIISMDNSVNIDYIKNYFNDIAKIELDKTTLNQSDKLNIISDVNKAIDYKMYLDSLINSGFLPTIQLDNGKSPLKPFPFKPKKIKYKGGDIWIDPENDYDMKIIKIVPTYKIKFYDKNNNLIDGAISPLSTKKQLQKNQISVVTTNNQALIINVDQIKNIQLSIKNPYSKGFYGSSSNENKQSIEEVLRYATSLSDSGVFYIIEGILESENDQSFPIVDSGINSNGSRYYKKPKGPISSIGAFIKMIVDIFSKLIPAISSLLKILTNPASFIVDQVIIKKLGDNNGTESPKFDMFSQKFKSEFDRLKTMESKNRKKFVESSSKLKNYVYVDDKNDYKFLMDGSSLVKFLGFTFGIGLDKLEPKLTFKANKAKNNGVVSDFLNLSNDQQEKQVNLSPISNSSLSPKLDISTNQIRTTANGITTIEEVSIQYSTGEFIEGVDYEYVYVTQYVNDLVIEAEKLEQSDDPESQNLAIAKYEEALESSPNNKEIEDKLNTLKNKTGTNTQPIIDFLLNLVTFPLKIIKGIIEFIMDFFKSLSNPFELPSKIKDFISFKWILDFFGPNKLLELIGIKFDISQLKSWAKDIDSFEDDHQFDLDKVLSMPFIPKMFSANKSQLEHLTKTPLSMLSSILCLIENIINGVIDFIWSLMGLAPILDAPHIKLCKDTNEDIDPKDAMNILNGNYVDALNSENIGQTSSYDFVYDISLPNGEILRNLNYEELKKWEDDNKDIQFELDF